MNNCTIQPNRARGGLLLQQDICTVAVCTGDFCTFTVVCLESKNEAGAESFQLKVRSKATGVPMCWSNNSKKNQTETLKRSILIFKCQMKSQGQHKSDGLNQKPRCFGAGRWVFYWRVSLSKVTHSEMLIDTPPRLKTSGHLIINHLATTKKKKKNLKNEALKSH